jgi:myo-inositol-1-phosphate synthase
MEGTTFGNVPLNLELKLEVWDSPNSAGVVIDAVRCAKQALDRKIGGALIGPSAYFMKSPPRQYTDDQARQLVADFIAGGTSQSATFAHRDQSPESPERRASQPVNDGRAHPISSHQAD